MSQETVPAEARDPTSACPTSSKATMRTRGISIGIDDTTVLTRAHDDADFPPEFADLASVALRTSGAGRPRWHLFGSRRPNTGSRIWYVRRAEAEIAEPGGRCGMAAQRASYGPRVASRQ
jgi:hypothetical protein